MPASLEVHKIGFPKLGRSVKKLQRDIDKAVPRVVRSMAIPLLAYTKHVTHVDTGALKDSLYIDYRQIKKGRAVIRSRPNVRNPRTGAKPIHYGIYEYRRGGGHAFTRVSVQRRGRFAIARGVQTLLRIL